MKSGLSGVNKVCGQCLKECKQWSQIKVIICPNFLSIQKGRPKKTYLNPASVADAALLVKQAYRKALEG